MDNRSNANAATGAKKRKRKTRGSGSEKDANKPKRPMTAYNYFFQEERRRILAGEDETVVMVQGSGGRKKMMMAKGSDQALDAASKEGDDSGGPTKITFEDLGRIIGQRWRDLDGEELVRYKEKAERDSQRYQREMKRYYEEQVSAMCHGYNDPVPSSLFRCADDEFGGAKETAGASFAATAAAKAAPEDATKLALLGSNASSLTRESAVILQAKKAKASPASSPQVAPTLPTGSNIGSLEPQKAQALLQQLLEQQRKDKETMATLLRQQGLAGTLGSPAALSSPAPAPQAAPAAMMNFNAGGGGAAASLGNASLLNTLLGQNLGQQQSQTNQAQTPDGNQQQQQQQQANSVSAINAFLQQQQQQQQASLYGTPTTAASLTNLGTNLGGLMQQQPSSAKQATSSSSGANVAMLDPMMVAQALLRQQGGAGGFMKI